MPLITAAGPRRAGALEAMMSLVKRPTLTPRKLEANQANARLSQGPVTAEGIEHVRDAHLLHGFYSKSVGEAIRVLGEKPDDFDRLLAALTDTWQPESDYELVLVRRLARALWRVERADRIQEAMTVNQVERVSLNIEYQGEEASARHKEKVAALERVQEQSQQVGFYSTVTDLQQLEEALGVQPKGRQAQILYLAYRLMRPSDPAADVLAGQIADLDVGPAGSLHAEAGKPAEGTDVASAAGTAGAASRHRQPVLAPATGEERDRLRSELRSLARQEIESLQVAYRKQRDRRAREISPAALDAAMAPDGPRAEFMLRSETAVFRQVKQLTELLMRFRRFRNSENGERGRGSPIENEGKSHDVIENKGPGSDRVG